MKNLIQLKLKKFKNKIKKQMKNFDMKIIKFEFEILACYFDFLNFE